MVVGGGWKFLRGSDRRVSSNEFFAQSQRNTVTAIIKRKARASGNVAAVQGQKYPQYKAQETCIGMFLGRYWGIKSRKAQFTRVRV